MPVIAATFTTLAAFAPMLFWPGMVGEFMSYLPQTLIVTLSSSLFVALVIIPTLCSMYIRLDTEPKRPMTPMARRVVIGGTVLFFLLVAGINWIAAALFLAIAAAAYFGHVYFMDRIGHRFQESIIPSILTYYERQLRWALEHRKTVLGGSAAVLILTFMAYGRFNHGIEFFPEGIPPKQLLVDVEHPVGTRPEVTNATALRLAEEVKGFEGMGDAESVVATVGAGGGGNFMQQGPSGPEMARVTIQFVDFQDKQYDAFETLAEMQAVVGRDVAGAEVTVDKISEGPPTGAPVNVEIIGEDPAMLEVLANQAIEVLENAPVYLKLVGLESDLDAARPELSVLVDREKAAMYGVSTFEVGMAVRGAINGIEAAKYRTGNDEYDIIVRLAPEFRQELNALQDLTVMNEGTQVPLVSVATWEVGEGLGSIRRKDMIRMATVTADVAAGLNSQAVLGEVQGTLAEFQASLPPGYSLRYTGENLEQAEAQEFLASAFLAALALIGFILISQFNSVVKPVIILTSVVMSTVGVLAGLMIFQMPFVTIMTGVGIISLAGIVVNNAIVLIDYIDILRDRDGMDRREALVQGGKTRFRPVILTAMTTALGLIPLAIGLNFDFFGLFGSLDPDFYWGGDQAAWWAPMAIAVIVGILFATFLTLVLVPVMYSLVDDFTSFFRRNFVSAAAEPEIGEDAVPEVEIPAFEDADREAEPAAVYRTKTPRPFGPLRLRPQAD